MNNIMIQKIKKLMQKRDITIRELAKEIGVTEVRMAMYMMGNRTISEDDLVKIAKVLDTTTDYLVGLDKVGGIDE